MSPANPEPTGHQFDISADYHKVYLDDCRLHEELTRVKGRDELVRADEVNAQVSAVLTPEAFARHLGVARGTPCILTARYAEMPMTIEM